MLAKNSMEGVRGITVNEFYEHSESAEQTKLSNQLAFLTNRGSSTAV